MATVKITKGGIAQIIEATEFDKYQRKGWVLVETSLVSKPFVSIPTASLLPDAEAILQEALEKPKRKSRKKKVE